LIRPAQFVLARIPDGFKLQASGFSADCLEAGPRPKPFVQQ
jgi:hypothetical protein